MSTGIGTHPRGQGPEGAALPDGGADGAFRAFAWVDLDLATLEDVRAFAREHLGWMLSGPMLPLVTDLFDRIAAL